MTAPCFRSAITVATRRSAHRHATRQGRLEQTREHHYNPETMEKMDILISWSGPPSRAVAEALKEYLPMIVNAFNPWLSSADIDKGSRWSSELAEALTSAKAGIICLMPNNLPAPYILFEAGALSKTVEKSFVRTLLIGMEPSDVSGPLALFQATKPTKDDLLQLLKTLNRALGENALKDAQLQATFDLCLAKT